jgi:hypothetical protein
MSRHPQDAGESGGGEPVRARIDAQKIIAPDGKFLARWIDSALVNAGGDLSAIEAAIRETSTGRAIACWSGSPDATGDDPFPDDPSAWTPGAWSALDDAIGRLGPLLTERNLTLLIRPHHRHVVGDVPSVGRLVRTLREKTIEHVGVVLDVESMLAPSMREKNPDDHRRRIREALASITPFEIV